MNCFCQGAIDHLSKLYRSCTVYNGSKCEDPASNWRSKLPIGGAFLATKEQVIAELEPIYRSGMAARLAGIPVETLRVWERRYAVVARRLVRGAVGSTRRRTSAA